MKNTEIDLSAYDLSAYVSKGPFRLKSNGPDAYEGWHILDAEGKIIATTTLGAKDCREDLANAQFLLASLNGKTQSLEEQP